MSSPVVHCEGVVVWGSLVVDSNWNSLLNSKISFDSRAPPQTQQDSYFATISDRSWIDPHQKLYILTGKYIAMVILHKDYFEKSIRITLNIWYRSYSSIEVVEMSLDRSRIDPYIKKLNFRFYRWNFGLVSQFIIWILLSSLNTSFYLDLISEQLWVFCSENIFDRVEEGYSLKKKTWASETSEKSLSTERDPWSFALF